MEEKIIQLYENINFLGFYTVDHQKRDYVNQAKKLIPEIQAFTNWFLNGNNFGIEDNLYQALTENLLDILRDCMLAFEQEDRVLLLDALEYGIGEYLKMFLPDRYIEERNKVDEE
ncbi:MAG: hypothetical protein ACI4S1_04745 [Roseburia sp.]